MAPSNTSVAVSQRLLYTYRSIVGVLQSYHGPVQINLQSTWCSILTRIINTVLGCLHKLEKRLLWARKIKYSTCSLCTQAIWPIEATEQIISYWETQLDSALHFLSTFAAWVLRGAGPTAHPLLPWHAAASCGWAHKYYYPAGSAVDCFSPVCCFPYFVLKLLVLFYLRSHFSFISWHIFELLPIVPFSSFYPFPPPSTDVFVLQCLFPPSYKYIYSVYLAFFQGFSLFLLLFLCNFSITSECQGVSYI